MKADPSDRNRFTRPLIKWYQCAGRRLPWRETIDPYAIWVSEIMLQQTQVATVLPYYQRFLKVFPSIGALAEAEVEAVLKVWQGLGYYARARNLHKAAREVVAQYKGALPSTFDALHALPGIGRSSAGAILTIAFGQRHPILDGNVRRVLCRFFAVKENPRDKKIEAMLWSRSESLLPKRNAGLYLQAIMDLGATCCTPAQPTCALCPVKSGCGAYKKGLQDLLPVKRTPKQIPHFDYFAGVMTCGEQVLIRRRPLKGLLAGLWEFPGERAGPVSERRDMGASYAAFLRKEMEMDLPRFDPWLKINHVFTHFKMTLHVFSHELKNGMKRDLPSKWVARKTLLDHPFSSAHHKIALRLIEAEDRTPLFQEPLEPGV